MPRTIQVPVEIPDPEPPVMPDLSLNPIVGDLRERVATLEERTQNASGETAAEALRLAGDAHQLAQDAKNKIDELLAAKPPDKAPVIELHPPPALPVPEADPKDQVPIGSGTPTHLPIWHPHRWF